MTRESLKFDVVIVGAGPAGLSAACRLMQLANEAGKSLRVCVVEKGAEVGAHIISGAVFEPIALTELFSDWKEQGAPVTVPVELDELHYLLGERRSIKAPGFLIPKPMRNEGNYVISLGRLCRWLAERAEALGAEIFTGFAAADVLYDDAGAVAGVVTGDMGIARDGSKKPNYQPGVELRTPYTIFAEGCRGHLGKRLMERFELRRDIDPQHYGIGIKEIWRIDPSRHRPGHVVHTLGWPLDNETEGGGFVYHGEDGLVSLGLIVALNYRNPYLNPFNEMQRWKHHPVVRPFLEGGTRIGYGARAVNKGGWQSVPKLSFPGGVMAGCEAGFLNPVKIKGNHTAMKTGMLAAEAVFEALETDGIPDLDGRYRGSWVDGELFRGRNFGPALAKFGTLAGSAFIWIDQNIFRGKLPFTLHNRVPDHASLARAADSRKIDYPKPDGALSFDKLSSVYLSNTNHEEDQPCHLVLTDPAIPISRNLPLYDEPAQRYCPAAVYEIVAAPGGPARFQINAQNCVHCKVCDIKDPAQNINWVAPEGGGGPNYVNM
ncbi:electron-transferring-flavoprotein ubiquinone oxido-reductase [Methylocaldum marinum]|uniref:Electron transfer flavoprotein-ubiquinone oxidoreductase n=1 Tax=Methylocaldum marinum TaxID=1432792 RepID=A0A250KYU2_9GAMM|nr:electron-transferring-flavoprotein ubiquinone oxido-reductase [Methylocaldum marinum]